MKGCVQHSILVADTIDNGPILRENSTHADKNLQHT